MFDIDTMAETDAGRQVGYRFGLGVDNEAAEATAPFDGSSVSGLRREASAAAAVESSIKDSRPDPSARPRQADKENPAQRASTTSQQSTTKTRPAKTTSRTDKATTGSARYVPEAALRAELAKLEKLSNAALAGDLTAIDKLRTELDRSPHVWRYIADLQVAVEIKMIGLIAGGSPLKQEAFRKRCSEFRNLLADEGDSLLVKMALSRVVSCWMFAQYLELRLLSSADQHDAAKQLLHAERRLQSAMRTLVLARQAERQRQQFAEQN